MGGQGTHQDHGIPLLMGVRGDGLPQVACGFHGNHQLLGSVVGQPYGYLLPQYVLETVMIHGEREGMAQGQSVRIQHPCRVSFLARIDAQNDATGYELSFLAVVRWMHIFTSGS